MVDFTGDGLGLHKSQQISLGVWNKNPRICKSSFLQTEALFTMPLWCRLRVQLQGSRHLEQLFFHGFAVLRLIVMQPVLHVAVVAHDRVPSERLPPLPLRERQVHNKLFNELDEY